MSLSFVSGNCQPWGINDGIEAKSSGEQPAALCHFWPHKGGQEWVQYTWTKPISIKGSSIFWFDDTGRGECRLPKSWKVQALVAGQWVDVPASFEPAKLDTWSKLEFLPITTTALRLVVDQQDRWASGVHEWKVSVVEE